MKFELLNDIVRRLDRAVPEYLLASFWDFELAQPIRCMYLPARQRFGHRLAKMVASVTSPNMTDAQNRMAVRTALLHWMRREVASSSLSPDFSQDLRISCLKYRFLMDAL